MWGVLVLVGDFIGEEDAGDDAQCEEEDDCCDGDVVVDVVVGCLGDDVFFECCGIVDDSVDLFTQWCGVGVFLDLVFDCGFKVGVWVQGFCLSFPWLLVCFLLQFGGVGVSSWLCSFLFFILVCSGCVSGGDCFSDSYYTIYIYCTYYTYYTQYIQFIICDNYVYYVQDSWRYFILIMLGF